MRLLNKTIRSYAIYSIITVALIIPVFYLVINKLVVREIDEKLFEQKKIIRKNPDKIIDANFHDDLRKIIPDLEVLPLAFVPKKDSLYNAGLYDSLYAETIPYRVLAFPIVSRGQHWLVKIRRPLLEAEDLIRSIVSVLSVLLVVFVTGLILLNRKLSQKIWKPFYSTLQQLRQYEIETSEAIRPQTSGIDEFNDLNLALSELTKRNSQVYKSYKEFTENASHEMQTPLAIFQSKLELLIQTQPFTDEQASLVNSLSDVNSRLVQLNRSLLSLTKIENHYYHEKEIVELPGLAKKIIGQLKHLADTREISIRENYPHDTTPYVLANRALIEILFSNLFSNAIRYNNKGGRILVSIDQGSLVVRNTGPSTSLDPSKIFERFYKQHAHSQSTGLGLAISKKIADLYQFSLDYAFEEGWHIFTVSNFSRRKITNVF